MPIALTVLHILVCIFLILVVLLQTGKGADLAGAFGGGGSQTAFGARGAATLLTKLTAGSVILFMVTSFTLALLANRTSRSVVDEGQQQEAPLVPGSLQTPPTRPAREDQENTPPADEQGRLEEQDGQQDQQ